MAKQLSVLNIEDSEGDSDLIARVLKKVGYKLTIERVETAAEMRAALKKRTWDIIISDHSLPQFDSYAALKLVQEAGLDIPFITVSGTIGEENAVAMIKAGAHDFLVKDNLTRLIPAVERELESAKVRCERRQAQEALLESESRFRQVWEITSDAMALSDAEGIVLAVNPSYLNLYGYPAENVIGQSFSVIFPQKIRKDAVKQYKDIFASDTIPSSFESHIKRADGAERVIESKVSFITKDGTRAAMLSTIRDITERKQADETLRFSEKRFRALTENSADAITLLDAQGIVIYDSPSAPGLLGYSPEEWIGQSLFELIHPDDLPGARDLLQKLTVTSSARMQGVFRLRHKNNSWRRMEAVVTNLLDEPGIQAIVINYRDVTERKQAEDALHESEERFKNAFQYSAIGMALVSLEGKWLKVNSILCSILGYSEDEFLTKTFQDITHPDDLNGDLSQLNQLLAGGIRSYTMDKRYFHKDGRIVWAHLAVALARDSTEVPLYFISQIKDITERKQIEDALTRSELVHRSLFENVPVGLYRTSVDGYWLDVNPALVRMFGYPEQESLQAIMIKDLYVDPATDERFFKEIAENDVIKSLEAEFRRKDGTTFWAEDNIRVIRNESGEITFYEGSLIDITERKHSEQALRESEHRFHSLFNRMMDGVYRSEHEGRFVDVNPAMVKIFGYSSREEMLAVDIKNELYFEPEERGSHILDTGQEETDIYRMRRKDGSEIWVEDHGTYVHDKQGKIIYHEGILRDITERKKAEQVLAESEARFRQAIAAADAIPYSLTYGSDQYTFMGEGIKKLTGYASADISPALIHALILESHMLGGFKGMSLQEAVRQVREGQSGVLWQCEHRIRTRTGEERWLIDASIQVLDDHNIPTGSIGIFQDITERKMTEHAMHDSEARYRSLFDDSPVALWEEDFSAVKLHLDTLRDEGVKDFRAYFKTHPQEIRECSTLVKILNVNKATLKLFGAKSLDELSQILVKFNEDDPMELFQNEMISIAHGKTQFEWEGVNQSLDGREIIIRLSFSVIPGYEETFSKVIISMVDITALIQAEQAIRESEKSLRESQMIAGLGSYVLDFSSETWTSSQILNQIFGINESYVRTVHSWLALIDPDGRQEMSNYLSNEVLQNHIRFDKEYKIIRNNDGEERWVYGLGELEFDANNQPVKMKGIVQDITERKKTEAENKYQLSELEALYENGLAISRLLEPKQIAQKMAQVIDQKLDWHHAAIRLYDVSIDRMELLALNSPGFNEEQIAEQIQRINQAINTPDKGLSGWVIRHGEVVRLGELKDDPRYFETYAGINSGLYVPIKSGDEVIGAISIESEQKNAFTERDAHTLTTLANQAAISFVNARLYQQLEKELDERHRAEEEVRTLNIELEKRVAERTAQIEATKRRLELATHAGQIGVWEYNPRENQLIWDERMYTIHQVPQGDFGGKIEDWARLVHPDDLDKSQIDNQLAFTQNPLQNNEHRIVMPDGSVRHVNTNAVTVFSDDGTANRVIGITIDITDRKQVEQSLRESENYARLLFDAVADPVSVTEGDALIVDVNKAFEKQYNLVREDIRGKRISEVGIYPETELSKRENYLSEILNNQSPKPVELDFYMPGDRIHTLELHSYLLMVNGRQLVLNTAHDITSHKKAEEAQRLAKSEMERALRIKNEFLATMSHELRTPLNSILGISESLEEQIAGALNEKQLRYIGIVRESGRHLLDLINDILDLSKIEAGRMELDIHNIAVEKLCQASLRMIKELAQKKSLNVSYHVNEDVKIISGDERRLKQSLVNLLSNAVKFTPTGSRIGLEVFGNAEKNEVEFSVWDQGIGIAEQDLKHLFKPFVQLDAGLAREYQGTGLGLALVAQMANLHGGSIRVESEAGSGSRFTITLPWSLKEQRTKAKVTAQLPPSGQKARANRNGRILLVEDTDVVVQLVSEYLRYKGYEVLIAHNGAEGVRLATEEHPSLILMDVMMPIMNGLEATEMIRADETLKSTPIIALTALAMSGDSERCLAAGMNDYLSKPIQMQNLADMIEKYLGPAMEKIDAK